MSDDRKPLPADALLNVLRAHPEVAEQARADKEAEICQRLGEGIGIEAVWDPAAELKGRQPRIIVVGRLGTAADGGLLEKGSGIRPCAQCGHPSVISRTNLRLTAELGTPIVCEPCTPRFLRKQQTRS